MNAANEIAVDAFLNNYIPFLSITKIVDLTLNKVNICPLNTIDDVIAEDFKAREIAKKYVTLENN